MEHSKDTIVLYPSPGIGHVVAIVELGKLILRHHNHVFSTVTIILTSGLFDSSGLTSYIQCISKTNPTIAFCFLPPLAPAASTNTFSRVAVLFDFIRRQAPNIGNCLQQISKTCRIRAFVIDMFCSSALPVARELDVPTYYFFTSGAAILQLYLYCPVLDETQLGLSESYRDLPDKFIDIPGLPPILAAEMPEPLLDRFDPAYHDILYFAEHMLKSSGIIVNTFDDLEPDIIQIIADGPAPPLYNIGPLIADPHERGIENGKESEVERNGCLKWLDEQPSNSVVFLCFGSRGSFSRTQIQEIANGLERSEQRFLWVVKIPPPDEKSKQVPLKIVADDIDLNALLPVGFLERTRNKGMVVKSWAPQVEVLNHESVGGFVTHCGWNSVLEALLAGVPMVAWPLYAEQHVNKAVLVESMKMAVPVKERKEDGIVSANELEKRLRELMESEHGRELKERSKKTKEMAVAAWAECGSSATALAKLVDDWQLKG